MRASESSLRRSFRPAAVAALLALGAGGLTGCKPNEEATTAASPPLPALKEVKGKAQRGDAQAQEFVGEIYVEGKQATLNYPEAATWFRMAADQGLAKAQYNLGTLYDAGQGVPHDEAEAAKWYRKAADQGNTDAQYTLAGMYQMGRGVPMNVKEAIMWQTRAAELGDPLARYNLAERYERGKNVTQDLVEAYKWHTLAAERGLKDAASARDRIGHALTSDQLADARKRVAEFKTQHPLPSPAK